MMPDEEKLFYSIGEAAQIVNVKPYVLRYWETEFTKLNPQKSETGQRTYRKKDIRIALTIKRLLYEEQYTIAGALKKLEDLEKEGLDQMDMFGVKTPTPQKNESASDLSNTPATTPGPVKIEPPKAPVKPTIPREKVMELKNLIAATNSILKKYNLA